MRIDYYIPTVFLSKQRRGAMFKQFKYIYSGDKAILIEIDNQINENTIAVIRRFMQAIEHNSISGIVEMIPTYTALLITYDPLVIDPDDLIKQLVNIENTLSNSRLDYAERVHIPVLYGGEMGEDIEHVAQVNNLSIDEVIQEHSGVDYLVYMLGFTPGFPYLGGMSHKIETPRRKDPRLKVSKGSVGIAGSQTGIYSIDSPGGWQIIGRTPLQLFDINTAPPVLLHAGQYIRFEAITLEEYKKIEVEVQSGTYTIKRSKKEKSLV